MFAGDDLVQDKLRCRISSSPVGLDFHIINLTLVEQVFQTFTLYISHPFSLCLFVSKYAIKYANISSILADLQLCINDENFNFAKTQNQSELSPVRIRERNQKLFADEFCKSEMAAKHCKKIDLTTVGNGGMKQTEIKGQTRMGRIDGSDFKLKRK